MNAGRWIPPRLIVNVAAPDPIPWPAVLLTFAGMQPVLLQGEGAVQLSSGNDIMDFSQVVCKVCSSRILKHHRVQTQMMGSSYHRLHERCGGLSGLECTLHRD